MGEPQKRVMINGANEYFIQESSLLTEDAKYQKKYDLWYWEKADKKIRTELYQRHDSVNDFGPQPGTWIEMMPFGERVITDYCDVSFPDGDPLAV